MYGQQVRDLTANTHQSVTTFQSIHSSIIITGQIYFDCTLITNVSHSIKTTNFMLIFTISSLKTTEDIVMTN